MLESTEMAEVAVPELGEMYATAGAIDGYSTSIIRLLASTPTDLE